jgi:drug/metabolite transporter (DMT)-like permease
LGITLILLNGLITSSSNIGNKYIFEWNTDLQVLEQQYLRGLIIVVVNMIMINVRFRKILWTSIPKGQGKFLALKATFGFLSNTIQSYALKYLPVGQVSVIYNINPVFTVILGGLVFKEKVTPF